MIERQQNTAKKLIKTANPLPFTQFFLKHKKANTVVTIDKSDRLMTPH
jgi:hypothetical protein